MAGSVCQSPRQEVFQPGTAFLRSGGITMVSQNPTDVAAPAGRGFVTEETVITSAGGGLLYSVPSFWGAVIAGTLTVLTIGIFSECLMFGCHVGVATDGMVSFGPGAAIWLIVTACIAYFVGGLVAGQLSYGAGLVRGLTVWGLSVPLVLVIGAMVSGGAGLAYSHFTHVTEQVANGTGASTLSNGNIYIDYAGAWIAWLMLLGGLIFALIGASIPCSAKAKRTSMSS
jgi:hypothetical protein